MISQRGVGGVDDTLALMDAYSLTKDDFDSIMELQVATSARSRRDLGAISARSRRDLGLISAHLGTDEHPLRECLRAGRDDKILLKRKLVAGVAPAIDHVEARHLTHKSRVMLPGPHTRMPYCVERTGIISCELPARSAKWRYRGTPFAAAPAFAAARETPSTAFAPSEP